ncbi:hypothetical protein [Nocardioides sp.]|uniref:hypothetical protein n=1 Tax=Nocardioides sp. TaxID=35761 RepID=UPI0027363D13|nr:hypothetical protein [Nocardioides sp.]MDP3893131.1 hypothetical protein [Nocardioides sp.]
MPENDRRENDQPDHRAELLQLLMDKVVADTYPSTTMLNLIEELLTPDEVLAYAEILFDKFRNENYPSIPMMDRLRRLAA